MRQAPSRHARLGHIAAPLPITTANLGASGRGAWRFACIAFLAAFAEFAAASHTGEALLVDQQAVVSNDQLLGALRAWETAGATQRPAAAQRLMQQATARRERMLALLDRNPKLAALRVLPAAVRDRLPAPARAWVEQPVTVSGTIIAMVASDPARGRTQQRFYVLDAAGQRLELHLADATERQMLAMVGKRGSVSALQFERQLLVLDKRHVQLAAAGAATDTTPTGTATTGAVQGDQTTLVILANFSDQAVSCTAADVQNRLFGSSGATMNQGYRQSSGNLVSFSGQAVGPFSIDYASTGSCDINGWAAAAQTAARAAGFDAALYKRVSYVMPANPSCGWTGLASIGGPQPTQSWVQNCASTGLFSHELGHNLQFHHAATPSDGYGDASDPMGAAKLVQSNAANRVMAGWLAGSQVRDVSYGGSYAVDAVESATPANPRVLRLAKPDTAETYYLSVRQPTDIDAALNAGYLNSLSIHRSTGTLPARTYLLANLAVGQSWSDSTNGIQVTLAGLTASTASVGVAFVGGSCVSQAPTLAISPTTQQAVPGSTLGYAVTVSNNDSPACAPSSIGIAQALPSGFSGILSATNVTLAPGASADLNWNVASPASSLDASYTLTATATALASGLATDGHASYVVLAPPPPPPPPPPTDTTPPTLTLTSPASGASLSGAKATISATASDASGVKAVAFYIDGKLLGSVASAPYSLAWSLRKVSRGSHTVRVRAIDASGNAAEQTVNVTVN